MSLNMECYILIHTKINWYLSLRIKNNKKKKKYLECCNSLIGIIGLLWILISSIGKISDDCIRDPR